MGPIVAALLAHQGGWDEMLMVAGPIFLFWLILKKANQRASTLDRQPPGPEEAPEGSPALDVDSQGP